MIPAIEATDLVRVHSTRDGRAAALQGLTLEVPSGELLVVFGPSGSGKTTLLRILAGLDAPSAGRVRVLGVDVRTLQGRRREAFRARNIGYSDQHYSRLLAPELRVGQLVELPLALAGEPGRARRKRTAELLERVGLGGRADAYPGELSGGEQQRVVLCAAVATRPPLLLADEPTGELDASTAAAIYRLVADLVREHGGTAVIVSHDAAAGSIADRVVQIRDGRIAAEQFPGEDESLVVNDAGWLRVPEELRARTAIGTRAWPSATEDGLTLNPARQPPPPEEPALRPRAKRRSPAGTAAALQGVERRFDLADTPALSRLTAEFSAARLTAVSGPSGSGKTTLLHLLAGLDVPTTGDVVVLGEKLSALGRSARAAFRRDHVGIVAQDPALIPFLTARENVELAGRLRAATAAPTVIRDALEAVALRPLADQRLSRLSMGERQRVAIARALVAEPELLLADEPTARLDQAAAAAFGDLLDRLVEERGLTVIFSTHDQLLLDAADHVLEL